MEAVMPETKRSLTDAECLQKALECRQLAKSTNNVAHRTLLEHMADTWGRIAADIMKASREKQSMFTTPSWGSR